MILFRGKWMGGNPVGLAFGMWRARIGEYEWVSVYVSGAASQHGDRNQTGHKRARGFSPHAAMKPGQFVHHVMPMKSVPYWSLPD